VDVDAPDARGPVDAPAMPELLAALGGAANVRELRAVGSRLLVTLNDAAAVNDATLRTLRLRGVARPAPHSLHLIVGPNASHIYGLERG
jgi:phosphotransferase system IIB component